MQARRTEDPEALAAIREAVSRILSVAVIHEFLSRTEGQSINIRDVCQRIVNQNGQVAVTPGTEISFAVEGPSIYLPSQQATAIALVVNELIQNAVEHGFEIKKHGHVRVGLTDCADRVKLEICDDGDRLPDDFSVGTTSSLGLLIVRTLVQEDLHGDLSVSNHDEWVVASVEFPKLSLAADEG
jgi:two-component sensor histidine kinase